MEAGLYILENIGIPDRDLELDRIDTNGNYEPGNLRFISHKGNQANKRSTVLSHWDSKYWPYSYNVVIRKLRQGLTRQQIIADARKAVKKKRKCWRLIQARLEFMTYEMPDHITVTPYREN